MKQSRRIKHCFGYIRVSTPKQEKDGMSIKTQETKIEEWAKANDRKVIFTKVDAGVSGTLPYDKRPGIMEILKNIRKGDVFVTISISRLGRSLYDSIDILRKLKELEANYVSIEDGYNTTTPNGTTIVHLMSVLAELQAKQIGQYARENYETFKQNGRHYGSVPYGYRKRNEKKGSGLEEVPEQQEVIRLIRYMRAEKDENGYLKPFNQIAVCLNKQGVPSPKGKKWSINTIIAVHDRVHVDIKGRKDVGLAESVD